MPTMNQAQIPLLGGTGSGLYVGITGPIINMTKSNNTDIGQPATSFTLDGNCGQITTGPLSVGSGGTRTWTWNNTFFSTTSNVYFSFVNASTAGNFPSMFTLRVTSAGVGALVLYNYSSVSLSASAITFNYIVF